LLLKFERSSQESNAASASGFRRCVCTTIVNVKCPNQRCETCCLMLRKFLFLKKNRYFFVKFTLLIGKKRRPCLVHDDIAMRNKELLRKAHYHGFRSNDFLGFVCLFVLIF
jgi:hypothetical protein